VNNITNNFRISICSIFIIAIMQSCTSFQQHSCPIPCDEQFEALFPSASKGQGLEIVGKIRIELPQCRIRGLCRMLYSPDERLRIDFRQSSLFGTLREEVTVLIGDSLVIYDRQERRFLASDSSRAILRRGIGENVEPDDILYALLLAIPRCSALEGRTVRTSGAHWELKARWRRRDIVIRGERGKGPREFRQCFADTKRCYRITYDSYAPISGSTNPGRLWLERENATERIDFELTEIKEFEPYPSMFDPGELEAW
jgi:hypothetical protein